jgi:hypothetical protein
MIGLEGFEPPTHGLGNENVRYPLFGISKLALGFWASFGLSERSMHHSMHHLISQFRRNLSLSLLATAFPVAS